MKWVVIAVMTLSALSGLSVANARTDRYKIGQVWEYRTCPGDEGSLLKIQAIEDAPPASKLGRIYHISIIGLHSHNSQVAGVLSHAPVSKQTLDGSVIRLSKSDAAFPDASAGIEEWRQANGGVFTISVADIVTIIDQQMSATN